MWQPPSAGPPIESGQRAMGPPLLPWSQEPQRPRDWRPPQPAARLAGPRAKLELVRPPAPARRPHRRRRRARLTTALRLYCVSYGDQLGGSGERRRSSSGSRAGAGGGDGVVRGSSGFCQSFLRSSDLETRTPLPVLGGLGWCGHKLQPRFLRT